MIMKHELPKLPYSYNALEPFIDAKTMEIHYTKHHQTYVDKLNAALEKYPDLQKKKVEDLLKNLNSIPEDIRTLVRNHGGGHLNHSLWWLILKKDTKFSGDIAKSIVKKFSSFEEFKKQFSAAALGIFGSGWAWLVTDKKGNLTILTTPNQDSPICNGYNPILGIDMWEHSFYLKWGPNKQGYVESFFNIINWDQVNKNIKIIK